MKSKIKIAVGISGGVDSSVAAYLLKGAGYDVTGVFLTCWSKGVGCSTDADRADALRVAAQLKIPFKVYNFEKQYQKRVIDRFYAAYRKGLTPNPDIWCNEEIKFGLFLDKVLAELKVDYIATGHYARVESRRSRFEGRDKSEGSKIENTDQFFTLYPHFLPSTFHSQFSNSPTNRCQYYLLSGVDPNKDQSYFLYRLNQFQLSKTIFPVGTLTKQMVREIASQAGLHIADKPDSQGICFVGNINVNEFLKKRLPVKKGEVVRTNGEMIGEHEGVWFYTIGQRHGFTIGKYQGKPLYVIEKDIKNNRLIVGRDQESEVKSFGVADLHWIDKKSKVKSQESKVLVRIRHLGELMPCELESRGSKVENVVVHLEKPTRGVAPGQHAVLYQWRSEVRGQKSESAFPTSDFRFPTSDFEVLGGGVIKNTKCKG